MKLSRVGKDPFEFILLQEKEKGTELLYTTGFHQTVLWKTRHPIPSLTGIGTSKIRILGWLYTHSSFTADISFLETDTASILLPSRMSNLTFVPMKGSPEGGVSTWPILRS
jgi:hypothetical protein